MTDSILTTSFWLVRNFCQVKIFWSTFEIFLEYGAPYDVHANFFWNLLFYSGGQRWPGCWFHRKRCFVCESFFRQWQRARSVLILLWRTKLLHGTIWVSETLGTNLWQDIGAEHAHRTLFGLSYAVFTSRAAWYRVILVWFFSWSAPTLSNIGQHCNNYASHTHSHAVTGSVTLTLIYASTLNNIDTALSALINVGQRWLTLVDGLLLSGGRASDWKSFCGRLWAYVSQRWTMLPNASLH